MNYDKKYEKCVQSTIFLRSESDMIVPLCKAHQLKTNFLISSCICISCRK